MRDGNMTGKIVRHAHKRTFVVGRTEPGIGGGEKKAGADDDKKAASGRRLSRGRSGGVQRAVRQRLRSGSGYGDGGDGIIIIITTRAAANTTRRRPLGENVNPCNIFRDARRRVLCKTYNSSAIINAVVST